MIPRMHTCGLDDGSGSVPNCNVSCAQIFVPYYRRCHAVIVEKFESGSADPEFKALMDNFTTECRKVVCPLDRADLPHGRVKQPCQDVQGAAKVVPVGKLLQLECKRGYRLQHGTPSNLTCRHGGKFDRPPPYISCIKEEACTFPKSAFGTYEPCPADTAPGHTAQQGCDSDDDGEPTADGPNASLPVGGCLQLRCEDGYLLSSSEPIGCLSGARPIGQPMCLKPTQVIATMLSGNNRWCGLVRASAAIGFGAAVATIVPFVSKGRFSLRPGQATIDLQPVACLALSLGLGAAASISSSISNFGKTLPLPCVSTAFVAKTPPLPCDSQVAFQGCLASSLR